MLRDRSLDSIFLNNFFKDRLLVFTKEQPRDEETYSHEYSFATGDWYPLKSEIDTYSLPSHVIVDLKNLFNMAEEYTCEVILKDSNPESKIRMQGLWNKIRHLAINIRAAARTLRLYTE